ncbi:hypothetical protein LH425_08325 [Laribacter hongkongensis]|uniref:hypothetical protein n=1 Tax=Laribacter hongkongensis TaxID=168471 RepID=UPI001EFC5F95|nr:hypothetical protein [Laribacter hongkongensis]MCG9065047.1 hypothetical protein [Laribacter hongkongensis]
MAAYKTVKQFAEENPAFTPSGLRALIFRANPRHTHDGLVPGNGLIEAGAIIRVGRRVLIDEEKFFRWVELQQHNHQAGGNCW